MIHFDALGVVTQLCLSCDTLATHRRSPEVHAAIRAGEGEA